MTMQENHDPAMNTPTVFFRNKRVAVTGACGTVGSELAAQLVETFEVGELLCLDNNESELFFLEQRHAASGKVSCRLTDIRDRDKLRRVFAGVDVLFHTAALKHVILCERSPFEAVQSNILGVRNVIDAAWENGVGRVVFTSSDKAVNPTNVMGTTKLMGERLFTAANSSIQGKGPIFSSTRFGNVLGSRGSAIPIFRRQIRGGGPVTLTDEAMTRFIMSISQAVKLVIESALYASGGEVLVTKMPAIRIRDLIETMIEELAPRYGHDPGRVTVSTIGAKPGEKLHEELLSEEEVRRAWEMEDFFIVLPAFSSIYKGIPREYPGIVTKHLSRAYRSDMEDPLTKAELRSFLLRHGLLDEDPALAMHPDSRYWPD